MASARRPPAPTCRRRAHVSPVHRLQRGRMGRRRLPCPERAHACTRARHKDAQTLSSVMKGIPYSWPAPQTLRRYRTHKHTRAHAPRACVHSITHSRTHPCTRTRAPGQRHVPLLPQPAVLLARPAGIPRAAVDSGGRDRHISRDVIDLSRDMTDYFEGRDQLFRGTRPSAGWDVIGSAGDGAGQGI